MFMARFVISGPIRIRGLIGGLPVWLAPTCLV